MSRTSRPRQRPRPDEDKAEIAAQRRSDARGRLPSTAFVPAEIPADIQTECPAPPLQPAQHATGQAKKSKPEVLREIPLLDQRCRCQRGCHENAAGNGCE